MNGSELEVRFYYRDIINSVVVVVVSVVVVLDYGW